MLVAEVVDRTSIRCLWCKEISMCPPYRPQSFFFKDTSTGLHDGHFWTCLKNPNVTLQGGLGVNVGEGKVSNSYCARITFVAASNVLSPLLHSPLSPLHPSGICRRL